ncbi:hypothetical protein AUJ10_03020 [Candidatus Pacearchaeota archaeon CG1_02_31_27]|nr:MAG: hypothetical protein AUJ10_03020 [Candidatus Pacearchaeota archaeon CG1_02_31_27]PIN92054.1 MAG: translation-associated GTPase [Candidatus Pacearchaeota archaeon CG10_big_fil_rev_8_21_14_0_10_31_59]PIZ81084.1 MAG: translation-associated GTPase [Candidatus Pacearchaeota archaeon CG_4_10_14_0_2_um_filter_31_10]
MLIGIVGKPNVGKSTFFKAATLAEVLIANYPFATIKANHAVGYVKVDCADKLFNVQCNPRHGFCLKHKRFVPVELMDVAGLVPGAHEGKGLGNQFLDDLRQADVLIHVVDISGTTDSEGKLAKGHDPELDIKFLEEELDFWYLGILKKVWQTFARKMEVEHSDFAKTVAKQFSGLKVDEEIVKKAIKNLNVSLEKPSSWLDEELLKFSSELRRLSKPIIIAANKIDRPEAKENFERIKNNHKDVIIIPCSAESELALREAAKAGLIEYIPGEKDFEIITNIGDKQKLALQFIQKNILDTYKTTGVQDCLNKSVFDFLKYIHVFPGGVNKLADKDGNILPDCFLLPPNSTALDFAYKIHQDLGDNFVKAIDVKTKRAIGREYLLNNGDIIEIVTKK